MDTLEDQKAFAQNIGGVRFPLIADPDGESAKAYGAFLEQFGVAGRKTVIIDRDGTILKAYDDAPLDGKGHAEVVLNDLRAMLA
jgi:peroxiredoxin